MTLELHQISISFNHKPLFKPFDLVTQSGEVQTIMGPSGCGKSTLLAAISGSLSPVFHMQGAITLNGRQIDNLPIERRKVGILFQDDLLFPHMNVYGNLSFALPAHYSKQQKKKRITESLLQAGLQDFEERDIATLSGGQRARISLLRTLLAEPDAVLFDEPFSKLDQELRGSFRLFVQQQVRQMNIPAILVSHDPEDNLGGSIIYLGNSHA